MMGQIEIMSAGKKEVFLGLLGLAEALAIAVVSILLIRSGQSFEIAFLSMFVATLAMLQGISGIYCFFKRQSFTIYYMDLGKISDFEAFKERYKIEDTSDSGILYIDKKDEEPAERYKQFNYLKLNHFDSLFSHS